MLFNNGDRIRLKDYEKFRLFIRQCRERTHPQAVRYGWGWGRIWNVKITDFKETKNNIYKLEIIDRYSRIKILLWHSQTRYIVCNVPIFMVNEFLSYFTAKKANIEDYEV